MRFIYTRIFTKIFIVFILVGLIVILDGVGYLGFVKDPFFRAYGWSTNSLTQITAGTKRGLFIVFTIKNLARENATLNQKVDELSFENARLKAAREENITLRKALNFQQSKNFNLLPVEVLNIDPTGFTRTIIISKGANDSIKVNQAVLVAPGLLVGKVTKLYPASAEVVLLTDPSIAVNAEVVDSGARGLIRGEHGLSLSLDLVTQNEVIKSGDLVITSGLSGDFPRGLLIGEISALRSQSTDLFQKAFVTPAADLRNLRFLSVIIP